MYKSGFATVVNASNRTIVEKVCDTNKLSATQQEVIVDPQTDRGLLASVAETQAETIISDLTSVGVEATSIGRLLACYVHLQHRACDSASLFRADPNLCISGAAEASLRQSVHQISLSSQPD